MNAELTVKLLELLEEDSTIYFQTPVPQSQMTVAEIRTAADGKMSVRLKLLGSSTKDVVAMIPCVLEEPILVDEPTNTTVLLRPWVPMDFYLRLLLGDDAPEFILYRCVPITGVTEERIVPGTVIGAATSELEISFLVPAAAGSFRAIDPAIILRVLALFHDDFTFLTDSFLELLLAAIAADPAGSFGLERFAAYHDALAAPAHRKRMLNDALLLEYQSRREFGIVMDATSEAIYQARLPMSGGRNNIRTNVVASFHTEVESAPDGFAYFYINDMNLHLAVFRADRYEMDLLDISGDNSKFSDLVLLTNQYKIMVNGPVFDSGVCYYQEPVKFSIPDSIPVVGGKEVKIPVKRLWEYVKAGVASLQPVFNYKGLTKGTLVFRGEPPRMGECPIQIALPRDRGTWRYHFAQTPTGAYSLHVDPIPQLHDYTVAVEPVIGVFRNGQRIGTGHEIDTMSSDGVSPRREPDVIKAMSSLTAGIPILGRCQRLGTEYLFALIRPDTYLEVPVMSSWEQMIALLRDINVIDAFFTDGDDSVGLIIDGLGMLEEPKRKKVELMPLAIGFRRV